MRLSRLALLALIAAAPAAATGAEPGAPSLSFPLACQVGRTCEVQNYVDRQAGPGVADYRCVHRTYEAHNGVDIRLHDMAAQRTGVAVLAAAPGKVARLRDGVADISVRTAGPASVKGQECGNGVVVSHGGGWETQYCHLAKGSIRVKAGDQVTAGTALARVGLSGNTEYPHLHVTVRKDGKIVDPFAPDPAGKTCASQAPLWNAGALAQLTYKRGAVLNAGFAANRVDMAAIERGGLAAPTRQAPYVVAYARAIGLEAGDILELALFDTQGVELGKARREPLESDKAQWFMMVGKPRPAAGWASGAYVARFRVQRAGKTVIDHRFETRL